MRVIDFGERGGAELEGVFYGGDEFILGIGFGEFGTFGGGGAGDFGAEKIGGFGYVNGQVREGTLLGRGVEGGHGVRHGVLRGGGHDFRIACEASTESVGDGRGGWRGSRRRLREGNGWSQSENGDRDGEAVHGSLLVAGESLRCERKS